MRLTRTLLAGCMALALIAVSTGPALADPPAGTIPRAGDVVGVGSDTIQYLLDQISYDYDQAHPKASSLLYSWDSTNPATGAAGDQIETKATCATIARPDGSGAGISELEANVTDPSNHKDYCVDYAGSSRAPQSSDPACATGGICFVPLAGDAVTWASRDAASGGTDAPASLTTAQLASIYECKITNWDKVGGKNAPIEAFLPQTSSGTRTFWLTALGGGTTPVTPGSCVSDDGNTLQDNQGVNPLLDSPEAIVPYSVGDYIGQLYHSAACLDSGCNPDGLPMICTPTGTQNKFGCDETGVLGLNEIAGSKPTTPWPLKPGSKNVKINEKFGLTFQRTLNVVVRYDAGTTDHIPSYLEPFFGAATASTPGYFCSSSTARKAVTRYGFLALGGGPDFALPQCGTPYDQRP